MGIREVALVNSTSCKLNNLQINKLYQIIVVAINVSTNYRSKSSPVYIETLFNGANGNSLTSSTVEDLPFLKDKVEEISNKPVYTIDKDSDDKTSSLVGISESSTLLSPDQIKLIEDPNLLNNYLIKYQNELTNSIVEYEAFQNSSRLEEQELLKSLKSYRKEFEEEINSKSKLENNVKDIEKRKDNLTFIKSKLTVQLKSLTHTKELHQANLDSLLLQFSKLKDKNKTLQSKELNEKAEIDKQITYYRNEIEILKAKNDDLELQIKEIGNQKKKFDKIYSEVKPLMEVLSSESNFNKDGNLKPNSQAALSDIFQIMPEWKNEIMEELDKTNRNETEWKHVFKSEIRKYMSIKQSVEIAKSNGNKNYQIPISNSKNEYQLSLEFGGYNNALPKVTHKSNKLSGKHGVAKEAGANANGGGWHNFYSQVYSNESNDGLLTPGANENAVGSSQHLHSIPLATSLSNAPVNADEYMAYDDGSNLMAHEINRVGSPFNQVRLDSIPLQDSASNLQQSQSQLTSENYNNFNYQPLSSIASNLVWNNSSMTNSNTNLSTTISAGNGVNGTGNTNTTSGNNYIDLNSLGYDNRQLPVTAPSLGGGNSGVSGFGELFQPSMNQSGTSFHGGETQLAAANPLRSTVFQHFKGLDLPQTSPPYINYTSPSPVPAGLEGFLMSPSPSGAGLTAENGNGNGLHSPSDSQNDLLHSDSLSIPGSNDPQIQQISPQLNHLPLNHLHHNLWSPSPYGHSRNISNHSQSQIWRNDEATNYGTTLSDYNKRTTGQQQGQEVGGAYPANSEDSF
ncbi:hypothetical protein CLIB1423_02S06788 [[Candida] railenensis]|uniref:Uncharacterized protein n=1 Tax=[Candida] railenensis TaxID=45579 RepID=A0A9P0QLZ1_9ASCO|nr:hypothetical protein CLIB1423_02S06788 [[Candida] railenensis]